MKYFSPKVCCFCTSGQKSEYDYTVAELTADQRQRFYQLKDKNYKPEGIQKKPISRSICPMTRPCTAGVLDGACYLLDTESQTLHHKTPIRAGKVLSFPNKNKKQGGSKMKKQRKLTIVKITHDDAGNFYFHCRTASGKNRKIQHDDIEKAYRDMQREMNRILLDKSVARNRFDIWDDDANTSLQEEVVLEAQS